MTQSWSAYLTQHRERFTQEFLDLLRIPSLSTDPESKGEVRRAAEWTANRLRAASMERVQVMETAGHPAVYGEWLHAPGRPTILFYGHFDVQPVDPLHLWETPPFEPAIRDGKVYARGATDMKGNMLLPIIACEALLQTTGSLPVNVKFLLEGEEEIGSPSLAPFIEAHRELFACHLAISADGGNGEPNRPVAGAGARGLVGLQINLRTANTDLHSGFGGMAPNPIHALVRLLDSMRDAEGRILVEGFYDEVRTLSTEERRALAPAPTMEAEFKARTGVKGFFGEPEYTPWERAVARPTLEVNGIWGGFQGAGVKTVIPNEAHAKITCRLVPGQTPEAILEYLQAHIRRFAPPYADVSLEIHPGMADPYVVPQAHPAYQTLIRTLKEETGLEPLQLRAGGTVPVFGMIKRSLGAETITIGGSQEGERAHAPNECYELASFERAQHRYCRFLQELGQ